MLGQMGRNTAQAGELRVLLEPRGVGSQGTYILRTVTGDDLAAVRAFFSDLPAFVEVRQLADGVVSAYAVQHFTSDTSVHTVIESALRRDFELVVAERNVSGPVLDLIHSLCIAMGSRELPVERCGICDTPQPFPTTMLTVRRPRGRRVRQDDASARYSWH